MVVGFVQTSSWISFFCSGGGRSSRFVVGSLIALSLVRARDKRWPCSSACWWRRGEEFFVARGNGRASRYTLSKGLLATDIICAEHK